MHFVVVYNNNNRMSQVLPFGNNHVTCTVTITDPQTILVEGKITNPSSYKSMEVMAPHPIDRRTSYHGSGLPFPCPPVALENTPNRAFPKEDGRFSAVFAYPNSYYTFDGFTKVKPSIFFTLIPKQGTDADAVYVRFELPEDPALFLRTLTHRPGRQEGPAFYDKKDTLMDPIPRSAEHVMRTIKQYKAAHDIAI